MPRCDHCKKNVPSGDLAPMPNAINVLACSGCREDAPHLKRGKKQTSRRKPGVKEDRMADKEIFSFHVFEDKRESEKDYYFQLNVMYSGLDIKLRKSMDEIRDFFTKRRRSKKLEAVAQD